MLQAGHSDVVLVDTMDELPSLADVQLAHLRLRALTAVSRSTSLYLSASLTSGQGQRQRHLSICGQIGRLWSAYQAPPSTDSSWIY